MQTKHLDSLSEFDSFFKDNLPTKHIFVELWAPFCHWCKAFVPEFNQVNSYFQENYPDDVEIVGVNG